MAPKEDKGIKLEIPVEAGLDEAPPQPEINTSINYDKGEITVELPYMEKKDLGYADRTADYSSDYGGGSSTFRGRDYTSSKAKISKAQEYFLKDSLARRIIELMAQFSATPVQLKGPQKYKSFFQQWLKVVGMPTILKKVFKEYYRSGNVHTIKCNVPFKGKLENKEQLHLDLKGFRTKGKMGEHDLSSFKVDLAKQIKAGEHTDLAARKLNWTNKMIPWKYTVLNPLQINKYGNPDFGLEEVYWSTGKTLKTMMYKMEKNAKYKAKFEPIINSMPVMLIQQLKDSKEKIELFPHFHSEITRMKDDYEHFAEPLMTPIFDHLFRKNQMREADTKIINSVINKILLIKVGNDKFPAKKEQLLALSEIFKEPSNVLELVWNHAIDIKWIDIDSNFLNSEKYVNVDRDIKEGFGITEILLGTTKDQKGNPFVSLRGLVENMADGQESASKWLQEEFEDIGEALKLDNVPEPSLTTINLEDKVSLYKIHQGMVDRGILSNQTVCELMGDDWQRNFEQIKKESKLREDGVLPMMGSPYQKGDDNPSTNKPGEEPKKEEKPGEKPKPVIKPAEIKGSQGRPPGEHTQMPARKPARQAANLEGDEFKTLARKAVKKLYDDFMNAGKGSSEAYNEAAFSLYKIPADKLSDFIDNDYKPNGEVDLNSADSKRIIEDIQSMASASVKRWRRDNSADLTVDDSLSILADSWAACVPVE